jgi:ABC-2 type transport system ATP-binding protein
VKPHMPGQTTERALELEHVTRRFGAFVAVNGISLAVTRGTICGFLGPNGAGKTTTIRMIMSILRPDEGVVRVLGCDQPWLVKDRLGYLPEERGLYKKMRARDILSYFGRLKGMPAGTAQRRADELLAQYGLSDAANRRCDALSKGMGQKVQLLGALIHNPELVILDEPFSGLDPVNVELMRDLITGLRRAGRTVIFSTHVMEQAEQLCDAIVLIHRGRKLLDGTLSHVKANGGRTCVIDYDGDGAFLRSLPGVSRVNDAGKHAELTLEDGADPQQILARLVGRLVIRRFDTREASLHEIFIRTVESSDVVA